jgi:hypothetical protein
MVECAFGIVCNKWRIFHCATGVCPDFYDIIVKTCCILHNFFRQRDGFQFQDTLYECPHDSIKAVVNRGNVTGPDIIIIIINCNCVITRWQWLFYMYTNIKKK